MLEGLRAPLSASRLDRFLERLDNPLLTLDQPPIESIGSAWNSSLATFMVGAPSKEMIFRSPDGAAELFIAETLEFFGKSLGLHSQEARRDDRVLQGRPILLLESDVESLDRKVLVKSLFLIRPWLANPLKEIDGQKYQDDHHDDSDDGQEVPFVRLGSRLVPAGGGFKLLEGGHAPFECRNASVRGRAKGPRPGSSTSPARVLSAPSPRHTPAGGAVLGPYR